MASFDVADSSPPPCSCLQRSCFKRQNPKISSRRRRIAPAIASNGHLFAVDVNSSSAIRTTRQPGRPISQRTNLRPADQVQKEEEMRPGCDMVVSAATCFFFSLVVWLGKNCARVTVILFRSEPPHHPRPSLSIGRKSMRPSSHSIIVL